MFSIELTLGVVRKCPWSRQCRMLLYSQSSSSPMPLRNYCLSKSTAVHQRPPSDKQEATRQVVSVVEISPIIKNCLLYLKMYILTSNINIKKNLLVMASSCKIRNQFYDFFPEILKCLKKSQVLQELPLMEEWTGKVSTLMSITCPYIFILFILILDCWI